jgi:hypothetical protein
MSQDIKTDEPKAKDGGGFFHRLFELVRHETAESDVHSTPAQKSKLELVGSRSLVRQTKLQCPAADRLGRVHV